MPACEPVLLAEAVVVGHDVLDKGFVHFRLRLELERQEGPDALKPATLIHDVAIHRLRVDLIQLNNLDADDFSKGGEFSVQQFGVILILERVLEDDTLLFVLTSVV